MPTRPGCSPPYFEPQPGELTPYWGHYVALVALGRFMTVDAAARVFLTLYVVALPFSAMALARALGRPARLGLLALPLALNAQPLLRLHRLLREHGAPAVGARAPRAPGRGAVRAPRGAGIAILAAAIFYTHVQSFAFLLLAAPILAACGDAPVKRALRAWPLLPATLGLFLPWLYLSTTPQPGADRYFPALDETRSTYASPWERLAGIPDNSPARSRTEATTRCSRPGRWPWRGGDRGPRRGRGRRPTGARPRSCWRPSSATSSCPSRSRASGTSPSASPGWPRSSPRCCSASAPRWIPAATLALAAATAANAAWHHVAFEREAAPFDRALATIPPGARVLGLVFDTRGQVMERWPYLHFEQYAVVRGGGMAAHSFTANSPMPVRLRRMARVPAPEVWHPGIPLRRCTREHFDYFLVRGGAEGCRAGASGRTRSHEVLRGGVLARSTGDASARGLADNRTGGTTRGRQQRRDVARRSTETAACPAPSTSRCAPTRPGRPSARS